MFSPFFGQRTGTRTSESPRNALLVRRAAPLPQQLALFKIVEFFVGEHKFTHPVFFPQPDCIVPYADGEAA